jgi:hypothetical protein
MLVIAGLLAPEPPESSTGRRQSTSDSIEANLDDIDFGALTETTDVPKPLSASVWGKDAKSQFIHSCATSYFGAAFAFSSSINGGSKESRCGCLYDQIESSSASFGEFKDAWMSREPILDVDPQLLVAMYEASFGCSVEGSVFSGAAD